jgi:hypothetical protein
MAAHSSTGAVAEMFDVSCLVNTPMLAPAQDAAFALWSKLASTKTAQQLIDSLSKQQFGLIPQTILGQHFFGMFHHSSAQHLTVTH